MAKNNYICKTMKIIISLLFCLLTFSGFAQKKETYLKDATTYYVDSVYKSTGLPVVKRSAKAKREFLRQKNLQKCPKGYEIDHIIPLFKGGLDVPENMQLLTIEEHKKKTIKERKKH